MSESKTINIVVFGIGNVGSTLINQINTVRNDLWQRRHLQVNVPIITNSKLAFYDHHGVSRSWTADFENSSVPYRIEDIIRYFKKHQLENCIAVDATASNDLVDSYVHLIENGFHIVSANKVANTLEQSFYDDLRFKLKEHNKQFLYETNVGAALPIVETIKQLHESGDRILEIKGVFSGSLSYIFNTFSETKLSFSEVLKQASALGLTEPDARDDLSGKDVARKLLILARELQLKSEICDVQIESLVPKQLNGKTTVKEFNKKIDELNEPFQKRKINVLPNQVLRYIGHINIPENKLEVKLTHEDKNSALGRLSGADSFFEIYSEAYKKTPLIIQGAGAGKQVTARGLLSDILKLSNRLI